MRTLTRYSRINYMDQCTDTPESITWTNVQILPKKLHGPMHRYSRINYMDQCTDTPEYITWTNALQNRCYMCIQWTRVLYSVVITWQSKSPISQFNSLCNDFTTVWLYNVICLYTMPSTTLFSGVQ